jgi:hypothetical protein
VLPLRRGRRRAVPPVGVSPGGSGHMPLLFEQLVGTVEDGGDDPAAEVSLSRRLPVSVGRPDPGAPARGRRLAAGEDVAQDREHPDLPRPDLRFERRRRRRALARSASRRSMWPT